MNLSHLYYFRTLAEYEHFTKAAEHLFVAQSTLSNAIANLENELGIILFERQGRAVKLTKYGREFQESVAEALNVLDKGIARARETAECLTGTIDVGTVYTIQGDFLPALVRAYRATYGSGLVVNLSQGLTLPLVEDLEQGRYELVFGAKLDNKPELTFVPLLTQELVALVHQNHPYAQKKAISLKDITQEAYPVITYRKGTPVGNKTASLTREFTIVDEADDEITIASLVDANPSAVGLVLNTLGIAPFKNLVAVPLSDVAPDFHTICLIYRSCAYKSRAVETFIEFTKGFVWPLTDTIDDAL